jgi:Transposase DDE domain
MSGASRAIWASGGDPPDPGCSAATDRVRAAAPTDLLARRRPAHRRRFTKSASASPDPARAACTTSSDGKRTAGFPPRDLHELQARNRADQKDPAWRKRFAVRSGVKGTVCELAHGHGMRHCRYRGQPKARLRHVLTAIAASIERLSQLLPGDNRLHDYQQRSRANSTSTTSNACAHGEPSAKPPRPRFPTESIGDCPDRNRTSASVRRSSALVATTKPHRTAVLGRAGRPGPLTKRGHLDRPERWRSQSR